MPSLAERKQFDPASLPLFPMQTPIKLAESEEPISIHECSAATRKTHSLHSAVAAATPSLSNASLVDNASQLETELEDLEATHQLLQETQETVARTEPQNLNVALLALQLGLEKEKLTNRQLQGYTAEVESFQDDIRLLLEFSKELSAYKENSDVPESMKNLLQQLKERNIDLLKGKDSNKFSKEEISELKSLSSSEISELRSNIQITFSTKIQARMQEIASIMDTVKEMIKTANKVISAANQHMARNGG